jgi:UDP-N-acetylmuramate dehydrogenase
MNVRKVFLKDCSSFKIGGEGDVVIVSSRDELLLAINFARENNRGIHILGEGTNTIFSDNLTDILFIKIEILGIEAGQDGDNILLTTNAGESWDDVVRYAVDREWWGIENLSLIPGTVGAAPVQNIGAYGTELDDVLVSVTVLDTSKNVFIDLQNSECYFGYRDSIFKQQPNRYIIVSVCLRLSQKPKPVLVYKPLDTLVNRENLKACDVRELVIATRQAKLPDYHLYPNTGSFFKNTVVSREVYESLKDRYLDIPGHEQHNGYKIPSAWLIERVANMKGVREGDVGTWPTQPLVLVNYGEASYSDLHNFSEKIIQKIYDETGIKIEREVNMVG